MRRVLYLMPLFWILNSCTTEGSQIEDVSLDEARLQLKSEMKATLDERIKGKEILKENYLSKVLDRSEFKVNDVKRSDETAKVQVEIKTIPLKVREALIDIMAKLDPAQENNFNVPDALSLISKQLGVDSSVSMPLQKLILLKKETVWKAQLPKPQVLTKPEALTK